MCCQHPLSPGPRNVIGRTRSAGAVSGLTDGVGVAAARRNRKIGTAHNPFYIPGAAFLTFKLHGFLRIGKQYLKAIITLETSKFINRHFFYTPLYHDDIVL